MKPAKQGLFGREKETALLDEVCASGKAEFVSYARELRQKLEVFQSATRTRKLLQLVLITLAGFKPNVWSEDLVDVALEAKSIFPAGSLEGPR